MERVRATHVQAERVAKQIAALPTAALARECLTNLEVGPLTESQLAHLVEAAELIAYGRIAAPRPGGVGEGSIADPSVPLMSALEDIPQLPLRCVARCSTRGRRLARCAPSRSCARSCTRSCTRCAAYFGLRAHAHLPPPLNYVHTTHVARAVVILLLFLKF